MPQSAQPIWGEFAGGIVKAGRFAPAGSGSPTYPTTVHPGWSVQRDGAGVFRITFTDRRYPVLVSFVACLQEATVGDQTMLLTTYVAPTATADGYVTLTVWDISGAAAADVAANANNQIHFIAVFSENEKLV